MSKDESLNNETKQGTFDPKGKPILKSPKNMVGYAEDAEVDPKQIKIGEMIKEYQEGNSCPDNECSDDELIECQKQKKEALEAERMRTKS